jgi:hypothetical protein
MVWELTQGQPWLIDALAYHTCFRMHEARDRTRPITADPIGQAKEHLIQNRVTHLDQLAYKLMAPRVRRVIEPMLAVISMGEVTESAREYPAAYCRAHRRGRATKPAGAAYPGHPRLMRGL